MFSDFDKKLKFYPSNREKVKWKVPGLFENDKIIWLLHDLCMELKIKQPVNAVFGGITSPWGGAEFLRLIQLRKKNFFQLLKNITAEIFPVSLLSQITE